MLAELERAWQELDADPQVRVIVNTGEGDAFQTGLDVGQLARDKDALREQSRRTKRAELKLSAWHNGVQKPVIAAVNGVCAGGGLHFVADADIVIAVVDRHVPRSRTCRSARSPPTRRSRWCGSRPWSRSCGWRSPGVTSASPPSGPASSGSSARSSTRPSGCATPPASSPPRSPATPRPPWPPPSGRSGARSRRGSPTRAAPGAPSWSGMWGHPDQEEGPRVLHRQARAPVAGDLTMTDYDDPEGRAPRARSAG